MQGSDTDALIRKMAKKKEIKMLRIPARIKHVTRRDIKEPQTRAAESEGALVNHVQSFA